MNILSLPLKAFEKVRDHFIPAEQYSEKLEDRYRFQLLSGLIISTVFLLSLFNTYFFYISQFKSAGNIVAIALTGSLGCFHLYLLFKLRLQKNSAKYANYFISSILLMICIGVLLTGGALENSTTYFLNVPILTAFLLLGRKTGMIYAALAFSFYLSAAFLEHSGVSMPQTIPIRLYATIEVMLWLFFSGTVVLFSSTYNQLTHKLLRQQEHEQEKQTYYATHDSLTLLANRFKFDQILLESLARSQRQSNQLGLYLIDLDGFKPINDIYGHDSGDAMLKHIAQCINMALRSDDFAARVGGDEFAIITQGEIELSDINNLSKRLIQAVETPLIYQGHSLQVSASIGIACSPHNGTTPDILIKKADTAMYACKKTKTRWKLAP